MHFDPNKLRSSGKTKARSGLGSDSRKAGHEANSRLALVHLLGDDVIPDLGKSPGDDIVVDRGVELQEAVEELPEVALRVDLLLKHHLQHRQLEVLERVLRLLRHRHAVGYLPARAHHIHCVRHRLVVLMIGPGEMAWGLRVVEGEPGGLVVVFGHKEAREFPTGDTIGVREGGFGGVRLGTAAGEFG